MSTFRFTSLLVAFFYFMTGFIALNAQNLVVNEYVNNNEAADEWVELISLEETDVSDWKLIDFDDAGRPSDTLQFTGHDVWTNLKPGTIILIQGSNSNLEVDTDPSDGILVLNAGNETYFSGSALSIAGSSDAFVISDSAGTRIHGLGHGSASDGQLGSSGVHKSSSLEAGESLGFYATTQKSRLNNSPFANVFSTPTPASGNDADQTEYFEELRPLDTSQPIMQVLSYGNLQNEGDKLIFESPVEGRNQTITIRITNLGDPDLIISDVEIAPAVFSVDFSNDVTVPSGDTLSLDITLTPDIESSQYSGGLTLYTNDPDYPEFLLNLFSPPKLSRDDRFEAVTWNIRQFGSGDNSQRQMENAAEVMDSLRADLYALQEIRNEDLLATLANRIEGNYSSIYANNSGLSEAYIYNTETISSVSDYLLDNLSYDAWASGRYPHLLNFNVTINNSDERVLAINIHAKAQTDGGFDDYDRRKTAAEGLYDELQSKYPNKNIIFLGDYNDDVTVSIYQGRQTPYYDFVNDTSNYQILTKPLTEDGQSSTISYDNVIDHITISNELFQEYVSGSAAIKNDVTGYIDNYGETTSDHYPVWAHFDFNTYTSIDEESSNAEIADRISLLPNYPNPFNPATTIAYRLPDAQIVSLDIYSITGQHITTVMREQTQSAGHHQVRVEASGWSSGVYVYRLSTTEGFQQTRTMTLIK